MSTAPWTLPSHASLFTGFYPHQLSSDPMLWFGAPNMTLAEALQSQGYVTAGFAANLAFCAQKNGITRGFAHYEDFPVSVAATLQHAQLVGTIISEEKTRGITQRKDFSRKNAADINRDFLNWQRSVGERPFFAFLNFFDAHDPYMPPEEFYSKFATGRPRGYYDVERGDELSSQDLRELRDSYDGALAYLDHQVGLLLTELESRGVLDQTLLIVTSDHGEQFGEHGLTNHVNSLYLPLLHVPLVMHWPGRIPAGFRSSIPVSLRNVPATIVEMLGLDGRLQFPGQSLSHSWSASGSQSERSEQPFLSEVRTGECLEAPMWYPARRGSMRSLTWSSLHYIKNFGDGREELYDFVRDPQEQFDLANDPSRQSDLAWLRGQLDSYRAI
jgi:arylsulfatase A-like enzyme